MQICNKTTQLGQEQEVGVNDPASTLHQYKQMGLHTAEEYRRMERHNNFGTTASRISQ